jgi:hypothetical protein
MLFEFHNSNGPLRELIMELMNHGYSERQAQDFLAKCYVTFNAIIIKRYDEEMAGMLCGK